MRRGGREILLGFDADLGGINAVSKGPGSRGGTAGLMVSEGE